MAKLTRLTRRLSLLSQVWVPIVMAIFTIGWGVRQSRQLHSEYRVKMLLDLKRSFDLDQRVIRVRTSRSLLRDKNPQYEELMGFFQTVGMLVDQNALDADQVWQNFWYVFERYFQPCKPHLDEEREIDSTLWQDAYNLHRLLVGIEERERNTPIAPPVAAELREFLISETELFSSGKEARQ